MAHIHQPPVPSSCPDCGYPRYDEEVCPGCGTPADSGRISPNVRLVNKPNELSPMLRLRQSCEEIVISAIAYNNTLDPVMQASMTEALNRAAKAVGDLVQNGQDLLAQRAQEQLEVEK